MITCYVGDLKGVFVWGENTRCTKTAPHCFFTPTFTSSLLFHSTPFSSSPTKQNQHFSKNSKFRFKVNRFFFFLFCFCRMLTYIERQCFLLCNYMKWWKFLGSMQSIVFSKFHHHALPFSFLFEKILSHLIFWYCSEQALHQSDFSWRLFNVW